MIYKLIILPQAVQDIREINFSYKSLNRKLADRFNKALKKEVRIIKQNSMLFQIRYDDFRVCKVEKFPYLIHYEIQDNLIILQEIQKFELKEIKEK